MRLPGWAWLALSSLWLIPLECATRPRYGGALTVELSAVFTSLEEPAPSSALPLPIIETLVRVNSRGEVEPALAAAWQHDADRKRWRFTLRSKVSFHDGEALTGANAAPPLLAALKKTYADVMVTATGQSIVVQSERALPDLLIELANPRTAIFRKRENSIPIGTGPFRVMVWGPGRTLTLAAFENYWGGRPYLDSIVINMGVSRGRADVLDIPFTATRRILPEGTRIWASAPRELIALVAADVHPIVLQALALSIDRAPLVNVLAQRRGEPAFGLLPAWLSGYSFLFQVSPDAARAKQLISQLRLGPLTLAYPANDSFARSLADRVALNARDAGIQIQPTPNSTANLRLVRWALETPDPVAELARIAELLGARDRAGLLDIARPETLYETERSLLDASHIIPLIYLPAVYGLGPRVHYSDTAPGNRAFDLRLENLWVDP